MLTLPQTWRCSLYRFRLHGWCLWLAALGMLYGYVQCCAICCLPIALVHACMLTMFSHQASTRTNTPSKATAISPSVSGANGRDTHSTFSNQFNSSAVSLSSSSPTAKLSPKPHNSSFVTLSAVSFGRWPVSFWARSERCRNSDGWPILQCGSIS